MTVKLEEEALTALQRLRRKPGVLKDTQACTDLWTHKFVEGSHDHAVITDAGHEYLRNATSWTR